MGFMDLEKVNGSVKGNISFFILFAILLLFCHPFFFGKMRAHPAVAKYGDV